MQTWKEVFSREEERQNLKNIGFCLLVVVSLVVGAFALTSLEIFLEQSRNTSDQWASESTSIDWLEETRE